MPHGATDWGSTYKDELIGLWTDYNADLAAITGQTATIPMYLSQQHAYPTRQRWRPARLQRCGCGSWATNAPAISSARVPSTSTRPPADDGVHLSTVGYQLLGEKTGQIFYERTVLGRDWQPLQPTGVERDGRTVVVTFHVPVPPLDWDEDLDPPLIEEWANGRGFELRAGSRWIASSRSRSTESAW
jgi:hypothetical protein